MQKMRLARHISRRHVVAGGSAAIAATAFRVSSVWAETPSPGLIEGKNIAEEGFIFGLPIVTAYGTMYEFCVDTTSSQYKGPFNQIHSMARVSTPADTAL